MRARYAWAEPLARISHNQLFFLTLVTCSTNSFCARRHAAGVARLCSVATASARRRWACKLSSRADRPQSRGQPMPVGRLLFVRTRVSSALRPWPQAAAPVARRRPASRASAAFGRGRGAGRCACLRPACPTKLSLSPRSPPSAFAAARAWHAMRTGNHWERHWLTPLSPAPCWPLESPSPAPCPSRPIAR